MQDLITTVQDRPKLLAFLAAPSIHLPWWPVIVNQQVKGWKNKWALKS